MREPVKYIVTRLVVFYTSMENYEGLHIASEVMLVLNMLLQINLKCVHRLNILHAARVALEHVIDMLLFDLVVVALVASFVDCLLKLGIALHEGACYP